MDLAGASILITGGRRIGVHLAELLAPRRVRLSLSYFQSREAVEACAERCRELGSEVLSHQADLRSPQAAQQLIDAVAAKYGRLDALLNLTSIYRSTPLVSLTPADYDDLIASNLTAPFHTAVAAARAMQRQTPRGGLQGKLIFFTDWAVDRPYRGYLPYLVAKGGLATLTRTLAVELAPSITVNAIAPGTVLPPADKSPERIEEIANSSLLQRIGDPPDVNQLVLYLLEGTDFATGEIYRVDGGRFLGPPTD